MDSDNMTKVIDQDVTTSVVLFIISRLDLT